MFIPFKLNHIVHIVNILFIIFVLFFERRESTRRLLWLMILAFFPGIGIIFYVLLSGHFFTGTSRMKEVNTTVYNLTRPLIETQKQVLTTNKNKIPNHVIRNFFPLMDMNLVEGNSPLSYTESYKIYCYGKEFFDDLCARLQQAKYSINMEYFIFHQDTIGRRVMDILCQKAREGVDVKLIYDDFGSIRTRTRFFKRLDAAGGKARPFFLIRVGMPLTLNYRNHRKVTVIDSTYAFIGGMNIGDEYANQQKRVKLNWRDTTILLTGGCVLSLQTNFLMDWYSLDAWNNHTKTLEEAATYFPAAFTRSLLTSHTDKKKENMLSDIFQKGRIPTQVITASPNNAKKSNIEDAFIRMIMSAKKNVYIETPYFTPDEEFYTALKLAAYSGIEVSIIIPGVWDKFYMKAASSEFAREMCGEGVHFYLYPGFIHSKMITVDGKTASIGTTNIDNRSFSLHYEENVIFYDDKFAFHCESIFERDRKISTPVTRSYYDKKHILKRAFWSFCKLFSPLM